MTNLELTETTRSDFFNNIGKLDAVMNFETKNYPYLISWVARGSGVIYGRSVMNADRSKQYFINSSKF